MNERLSKLISLFSKIEGVKISGDFQVKGTTLRKLAETNGGGYQRVLKWAEGKVGSKVSRMTSEAETPAQIDPEMMEMKNQLKGAWEVMVGRNTKYGDSWKVLSIPSMANLIEMKMHRIANMTEKDLNPKIIDEAVDAINYSAMILFKLKEKGIIYNHD